MAFENLFIRTKRSIGGVQLDGVVKETHQHLARPTKNPIESGSTISDHVIQEPKKIQIIGIVTDTPLGLAAFSEIIDTVSNFFGTSTANNVTRSQQAYSALISLKELGEPIIITTRLEVYNNMIITGISVSQDKDTSLSVLLNITAEQIIITESELVTLTEDELGTGTGTESSNTKKQGSTPVDSGTKQPIEVPEETNTSILKDISDLLGG